MSDLAWKCPNGDGVGKHRYKSPAVKSSHVDSALVWKGFDRTSVASGSKPFSSDTEDQP